MPRRRLNTHLACFGCRSDQVVVAIIHRPGKRSEQTRRLDSTGSTCTLSVFHLARQYETETMHMAATRKIQRIDRSSVAILACGIVSSLSSSLGTSDD